MKELISVVLCTYNGAKYIDEQVETIRNQSYPNLEIIIVDDASTDGSFDKLQVHSLKDKRIRLYRNDSNLGFNLNFNKACGMANGDYIAIADQDDVWEKHKIEVLVKEISADEKIMMVHSVSARFEEDKDPYIKSVGLVNFFEGNEVKKLFLFNTISGHNMLIRRKLLEAALPFPKNIYYDWWLALIACKLGTVRHVPRILVWHRMHESNLTGAAKPILPFYKQVQSNLLSFLNKIELEGDEIEFAQDLLKHYQKLEHRKFSVPLFFFLLRHAQTIFSHKRRKLPAIAYLKNAIKYAKQGTKA